MLKVLSKIFPSKSEKDVKRMLPIVEEINRYAEEFQKLSDEDLKGKTAEFRGRLKESTKEIEEETAALKEQLKTPENLTLEERELIYSQIEEKQKEFNAAINDLLIEILPEAFAVVKETCRRLVGQSWDVTGRKIVWDMVPFDVQLIGAVVLHEGKIAEMATGEGKTLVATMPMYLNALSGKGVHLVTVNDYLARRDSEWMGRIYTSLGLTVGCIQNGMDFG